MVTDLLLTCFCWAAGWFVVWVGVAVQAQLPIHNCLNSDPSPDNNTGQQPNKNTWVTNQLPFLSTNHQIDKIPIYVSHFLPFSFSIPQVHKYCSTVKTIDTPTKQGYIEERPTLHVYVLENKRHTITCTNIQHTTEKTRNLRSTTPLHPYADNFSLEHHLK